LAVRARDRASEAFDRLLARPDGRAAVGRAALTRTYCAGLVEQLAEVAAASKRLAEWNERNPGTMLPCLVLVTDEAAELRAVESPDRAGASEPKAQLAVPTRIDPGPSPTPRPRVHNSDI
jgi:hypothetical protein